MIAYSFLNEGFGQKISHFLAPNGVGKMLAYTGAGSLAGHGIGGFVGFLYGIKLYTNKEKTIQKIDEEIASEETSSYKRRELIDNKNLIMSMSDDEYRNFLISKFYRKGSAVGGSLGTVVGCLASRRG